MMLYLHNNHGKIIDVLLNDSAKGLHYTNDKFERYLKGTLYTFDFDIPKYIQNEPVSRKNELLDRVDDIRYVSFTDEDQLYYCSVTNRKDTQTAISFKTEAIGTKLISGEVASFENKDGLPYTLTEYINMFNILGDLSFSVGKNEAAGELRVLKLTGNETPLARLFTIASNFGCEVAMRVDVFNDGEITQVYFDFIKAYNENTGSYGIGQNRRDVILHYKNGHNGITREIDYTSLRTAIGITLADGTAYKFPRSESWKNADEVIEYFVDRNTFYMYAPLAAETYPSAINSDDCEPWIFQSYKTDLTDDDAILQFAYETIKKVSQPATKYTVTINAHSLKDKNLNVGDVIYMDDTTIFGTGKYLRTRITKISKSFTNPNNWTLTIDNTALASNELAASATGALASILLEAVPYVMNIKVTNPLTFTGESDDTTLIPELYQNDELRGSVFKLYQDDNYIKDITEHTVKYTDFEGASSNFRIDAVVNDKVVSSNMITISKMAKPVNTYVWIAYADDAFGTNMSFEPGLRRYIGIAVNQRTAEPQATPAAYIWSLLGSNATISGNILLKSNDRRSQTNKADYQVYEVLQGGETYSITANYWADPSTTEEVRVYVDLGDGVTDRERLSWDANAKTFVARITPKNDIAANQPISIVSEGGTITIDRAMLTKGTSVVTSWLPHWTEIVESMKLKADILDLNQVSDNLNQNINNVVTVVDSKVSADAFNANKADTEKKFITVDQAIDNAQSHIDEHKSRLENLQAELDALGLRLGFLDRTIMMTNEGLKISSNADSRSYVLVDDDEVTIYSSGIAVARFSKGYLNVENAYLNNIVQGRYFTSINLASDILTIEYKPGAATMDANGGLI